MEVLTLEEVKDYLRIDFDEDDEQLLGLILAATAYLKDAIDDFSENFEKNPYFQERAKLIAKVLIQGWYDNRESTNKENGFLYTVRSLLTQLQA